MAEAATFVLDACAVIAFIQAEPGAEVVKDLLINPEENRCIVHAVNAMEISVDLRRRGAARSAEALEQLLEGIGIHVEESLPHSLWQAAAELKARIRRISMADCVALATADPYGATLVTSDHHEFDPIVEEGGHRILFIR